MAVPGRKRKPSHKSSRLNQHEQNQKLQQGRKLAAAGDRVKPTNVGALIHDESDIISYRLSLKHDFILNSKLIDLLTTQPIPLDRILPPKIYPEGALELMRQSLEAQEVLVKRLKQRLDTLSSKEEDSSDFYRTNIDKLSKDPYNQSLLDNIEQEFSQKFSMKVCPNNVVIHRNKFSNLDKDRKEAPPDYWEKHRQFMEDKLNEERRAREQEEEQERQESFALEVDSGVNALNTEKPSDVGETEITVEDSGDPNLLDTVFGEEPFQTGFDDGFGDLDTAFFQ